MQGFRLLCESQKENIIGNDLRTIDAIIPYMMPTSRQDKNRPCSPFG